MLVSILWVWVVVSVIAEAPCNPLVEPDCFAINKALGEDFVSLSQNLSSFSFTDVITAENEGVKLTINRPLDNPTIVSNFYILFGKVEAEIQAAKGIGIITSFYLQSDDLDEIDIELFGGKSNQVQTNFFIKGNTTTWDRGAYHDLPNDPYTNYNKFAIEWTADRINWWINDRLVRFVDRSNPYGTPQSPMAVKFSLWAGGDSSNEAGTVEWAGGATDYSQLPFDMRVKNVYISDYTSGKYYYYGHRDGEWTDLTINTDGDITGLKPSPKKKELSGPVANFLSSSAVSTSANALLAVTSCLFSCL